MLGRRANTLLKEAQMKTLYRWKLDVGLLWFACTALLVWSPPLAAQTYSASWTSLDTHNPAPEWFQDAKFGIYYHWGAWCVAAYGSEWYPRNMYHKGSGEYNNQMSKYGDPFGDWPYDKFLTGQNDKNGNLAEFAPKLKSAGGSWDPDEWAQMFADAGAKYAGPVAEHHDGFSMWDSKVNEWNSVAMGPKLNLAKYHADAIRKKGLKLIMSQHTAFNVNGYYDQAPTATTDSLKKLYGQLPKAQEETLWLNKLKEIIDEFLPDIIWQDFDLNLISDANLTAFLAYYYNAAAAASKDVVATAKDGIISPHKGQVKDYERGGPADITTPYWLTDDAISSSSWSYTTGMAYYSTSALIHAFLDRISKGGNLLLNVSPMADGTFPQQQKEILAAFGKFLKQMGTAVYNTRSFAVYGEGPTKLGGGGMGSPTAMTSSDVRYTKSKDGDAVYAILMGWPGNGKQVTLASVTTSRFDLGSGKVFMFGPTGDGTGAIALPATQDSSGLKITLPSTQPYTAVAYAIKISKTGTEPGPTPWTGTATNPSPDGGVGQTGGTIGGDAGLRETGGNPTTGGTVGGGGASGSGGAGGTAGRSDAGSLGAGGNQATGGRTGAGGTSSISPGTGGSSNSGGVAGVSSTLSPSSGGVQGKGGGSAGGASSAGGSAASGGASAGSGGASSAGSGGSTRSGTGGQTAAPEQNGCSCNTPGSGSASASGSLFLLGLAVATLVRRRRR
jgi:alpha-L-fucosidase